MKSREYARSANLIVYAKKSDTVRAGPSRCGAQDLGAGLP